MADDGVDGRVPFPLRNEVELSNALVDLILATELKSDLAEAWLLSPDADYPSERELRWEVESILCSHVDGEPLHRRYAAIVEKVISKVSPEDLRRLRDFRWNGPKAFDCAA